MVEEETKGAVWQKLLPIEHGVRINVASIHPSASSADKDEGAMEETERNERDRTSKANGWMHFPGWATSFRQHTNSNTSSLSADGDIPTSPKEKNQPQPSSPLTRYVLCRLQ